MRTRATPENVNQSSNKIQSHTRQMGKRSNLVIPDRGQDAKPREPLRADRRSFWRTVSQPLRMRRYFTIIGVASRDAPSGISHPCAWEGTCKSHRCGLVRNSKTLETAYLSIPGRGYKRIVASYPQQISARQLTHLDAACADVGGPSGHNLRRRKSFLKNKQHIYATFLNRCYRTIFISFITTTSTISGLFYIKYPFPF